MRPRPITSLLLAGAVPWLSACATSPSNAEGQRQRAVEKNLLPAVVLDGRTDSTGPVPDRMARYNVPGLSVAVIDDGRIAWSAGYGVKRAGTADSVTATTLFQAASISKPVAAAAILRLVADGTLDLDADVNVRLRTWRVPVNAFTAERPVTLRGLLSHSAGVTVHGFPGYATGAPVPTLQQILDGVRPANTAPIRVDVTPGSISRYSGGGYTIAQQLIEDVTGKSFAAAMKTLVLDRVGMASSTYQQPLPADRAADASEAHSSAGAPIAGRWHTYPEQAAAGLWTTPTDLARFALAIRSAYLGESTALLDQPTARLMLAEVIGGTGLGFGLAGSGDRLRFIHGGSNRGYRCYLVMYPMTGDGVVVMTNSDNGQELAMEVVRSVARAYAWPDYAPRTATAVPIAQSVLDRLAGTYRLEDAGINATVARQGDHLLLRTPRGSWDTLQPTGDTSFVVVEDGSTVAFAAGADGHTELRAWGMRGRRVVQP